MIHNLVFVVFTIIRIRLTFRYPRLSQYQRFFKKNILIYQFYCDQNKITNINIFLSFSSSRLAENKKNAGNEQYKAQNYSSALRLYSDAINLCPESPAFYGNRSACYMMMGDYKAALKDSRDAVTLDEKFEKGFDRIVKCCLALGDIVAAEQAIKKLMEIGANNDAYKRYDDQCKQLRVLSEKATHCYDKKDFRTVGECNYNI